MLDLSRYSYFFAQSLDNKGNPEYWCLRHDEGKWERMDLSDPRLAEVRRRIDDLMEKGRSYNFGATSIDFRFRLSGVGVVTLRPITRDISGRVSPVLMLFCALGPGRAKAALALSGIPQLMGRNLDDVTIDDIYCFKRAMKWPRCALFFRISLFGRREK